MNLVPGRANVRPSSDLPGPEEHPRRLLAGVCVELGRRTSIDPVVIRLAFVALTVASGLGLLLYLVLWALLPTGRGARAPLPRPGSGSTRVAAGAGLLVLAVLLLLREWGLWWSDAVAWPVVLLSAGGALLWRSRRFGGTGAGAVLVLGAAFFVLQVTGVLGAAQDALVSLLVAALAIGVILSPYLYRVGRQLAGERAERIRQTERAELAAHLHDSVLQTLALVQRRADDPREVAALARRQERELRAWLAGRTPAGPTAPTTLLAALELAAGEVETRHRVEVEVVAVGDCPLDVRTEAVVAAAREAMVNAAKFAGEAPISVFAEAGPDRVQVFIRDRGPGFDPGAVPADRRGLRESIMGRMERHGGHAEVHSGNGTEVELVMERA